jgi:hypothetical protein
VAAGEEAAAETNLPNKDLMQNDNEKSKSFE